MVPCGHRVPTITTGQAQHVPIEVIDSLYVSLLYEDFLRGSYAGAFVIAVLVLSEIIFFRCPLLLFALLLTKSKSRLLQKTVPT